MNWFPFPRVHTVFSKLRWVLWARKQSQYIISECISSAIRRSNGLSNTTTYLYWLKDCHPMERFCMALWLFFARVFDYRDFCSCLWSERETDKERRTDRQTKGRTDRRTDRQFVYDLQYFSSVISRQSGSPSHFRSSSMHSKIFWHSNVPLEHIDFRQEPVKIGKALTSQNYVVQIIKDSGNQIT